MVGSAWGEWVAERAGPAHRREHQGLAAILPGARIDVGSRWSGPSRSDG